MKSKKDKHISNSTVLFGDVVNYAHYKQYTNVYISLHWAKKDDGNEAKDDGGLAWANEFNTKQKHWIWWHKWQAAFIAELSGWHSTPTGSGLSPQDQASRLRLCISNDMCK